MGKATISLMTAEDLYDLPDDSLQYELVAGRLISEPPASFGHGRVESTLVRLLGTFVASQGIGAVVSADTGFILSRSPDTVRCPDVAFVRRERLPSREESRKFFSGAPDLAVEVLSPSNRPGEIRVKTAEYLAAGAMAVWVVDPGERTVTVWRSLFAPRTLAEDDTLDGEDILPGFSTLVGEIFED